MAALGHTALILLTVITHQGDIRELDSSILFGFTASYTFLRSKPFFFIVNNRYDMFHHYQLTVFAICLCARLLFPQKDINPIEINNIKYYYLFFLLNDDVGCSIRGEVNYLISDSC